MATLLEMAADIVKAYASANHLTSAELVSTIEKVHGTLKSIELGQVIPEQGQPEEVTKPAISWKQSIKSDEIICLICGKGGMKTLARHLNKSHGMKPGAYKKQFGIPAGQSLTAKKFSQARREMAKTINLSANLEKARAVRMANIAAKAGKPAKKKATPKKK